MEYYNYPKVKKVEQVDNFHGQIIADPYRWMEDAHHPEVVEWMKENNKLVENYIDHNDLEQSKDRLTELFDYTRYGSIHIRNGIYFYSKNEGLQPQSIYYKRKGKDGTEELLFDPNTLSEDGTVSVMEADYSEDGQYVVFSISVHGSDWQYLRIMNTETKQFLEERIENIRNHGAIQWKKDGSGFYYSAFINKDESSDGAKLWWHTINTTQSFDALIYEHEADKKLWATGNLYDNEKYLFITLLKDTMPRNMLYYQKVGEDQLYPIHDELKELYRVLTVQDDIAYILTNKDAPNCKVIAVDLKDPEEQKWKDVIPESDKPIDYFTGVTPTNNLLLITYINDVKHEPVLYDYQGNVISTIQLPTMGTVYVFGRKEQKELFIYFTSVAYPSIVYMYNFEKNELEALFDNPLDLDPDKFKINQVFFPSKDGTKIPMFIIHPPNVELNSQNPTLLYGYGGFSISQTLNFNQRMIQWVEQGGIYAVANLRGGGEYGEEWHNAGILENKQNVFDDFISAAEYLIKEKYTQTKKLAILGGSNGGLLTAACMLQQPNLFGAVITAVGVLDMLRYYKFTIGHFWVPEYGNPENPEHFKFLIKYSPLHNINEVEYPPTLVTSADTDDRVDPSHSRKYIATLQEKGKGGPLLMRMVIRAGHGAGKPTKKIIEDMSYHFAFLKKALKF